MAVLKINSLGCVLDIGHSKIDVCCTLDGIVASLGAS